MFIIRLIDSDCGIFRQEFRITVIDMLKTRTAMTDNINEQMSSF